MGFRPGSALFIWNTMSRTRYEITNYLGNVNVLITDRKAISVNYVKNSFKTAGNTEGWTATNATVSISSRYLRVTPTVSGSTTQKTDATIVGKRYFARIKSDKGSGPALQANIPGIDWVKFTNVILYNERSVPNSRTARMWVINNEVRPFHYEKIKVGVKGNFREGSMFLADCEVFDNTKRTTLRPILVDFQLMNNMNLFSKLNFDVYQLRQ